MTELPPWTDNAADPKSCLMGCENHKSQTERHRSRIGIGRKRERETSAPSKSGHRKGQRNRVLQQYSPGSRPFGCMLRESESAKGCRTPALAGCLPRVRLAGVGQALTIRDIRDSSNDRALAHRDAGGESRPLHHYQSLADGIVSWAISLEGLVRKCEPNCTENVRGQGDRPYQHHGRFEQRHNGQLHRCPIAHGRAKRGQGEEKDRDSEISPTSNYNSPIAIIGVT